LETCFYRSYQIRLIYNTIKAFIHSGRIISDNSVRQGTWKKTPGINLLLTSRQIASEKNYALVLAEEGGK
jgi:hypothetical protein